MFSAPQCIINSVETNSKNHTPARLDLVVPIYNEVDGLQAFYDELCHVLVGLEHETRLLFVDDGSTDDTPALLSRLAESDPRVAIITLSRNFGHQVALTAGLDRADADIVITLDGDGQHPPELIPQMLDLSAQGFDIVLTERAIDSDVSAFKRLTAHLFYAIINRVGDTRIQPNSADFRLLTAPVVAALHEMREYHRFLRGMIGWMGYRTVILPYHQPERFAGRSKYSLRKMVRLFTHALFSFSMVPVFAVISMGALFFCMAAAEVVYVLSLWLRQSEALVPGWSSLMFMLLMVGGALMTSLGFIGVYVGNIFREVKRRPLYLVREEKKSTQRLPY